MKYKFLIVCRNIPDSHCDGNLDGPGGGCAPPDEPVQVATGPDIVTYKQFITPLISCTNQ